jgi:hypothetical protein
VDQTFRRQFVLARKPVQAGPDWRVREIGHGWVLSFQEALAVAAAPGTADEIVLGALLRRDPATGEGAGRYVRIAWPHVLTDPAALLSVYHGGEGEGLVAAASPALAAFALTGTFRPPDIDAPLSHRALINYVPAPGSRWRGVRRLLPDQRIDLARGRVEHRPRPVPAIAGIEAATAIVAEELLGFAEDLRRQIPGTVFLPLTAGRDSRTVAAAFLAAGLPFETVTTRFPGKPETDITMAAAISARFGIRHHVIDLEPARPERGAALAEHVGWSYDDWDISHLFPGNAYRYQREGDAMIVAGCFEFGWPANHARLLGDFPFETATGEALWRAGRGGSEAASAFGGFLQDWLDWRRAHPTGLDWLTQFYLDQRLGAWRAGLEHGYDLLPALALHPANNARILAALRAPSPAERTADSLQERVIGRLAPDLLAFPVNPISLAERGQQARYRMRRGLTGLLKRALGPGALHSIRQILGGRPS